MNAVIYTKDDQEYASLAAILRDESDQMDVFRDPLDGFNHCDYPYDVVVVALEGARGMNEVLDWSERYPNTGIVWITSDPDFVNTAFRRHLSGFLTRPFNEDEFREAAGYAIRGEAWQTGRRPGVRR